MIAVNAIVDVVSCAQALVGGGDGGVMRAPTFALDGKKKCPDADGKDLRVAAVCRKPRRAGGRAAAVTRISSAGPSV